MSIDFSEGGIFMRKRSTILFLLAVVLMLSFISCTRTVIVIPNVPANPRATALAGVAGVELKWDAVNGAVSYDVTITKEAASGSRETFGPYNTTNAYYLATRDVLGAGTFDWTVSAKNTAGSSDPVEGPEFDLAADPVPDPVYALALTLTQKPEMVSNRDGVPTIYAYEGSKKTGQRIAHLEALNYILAELVYQLLPLGVARENMSIQFMVEEIGSGEAKRWPDSDTEYLLDEEGQLVIGVNSLGENFEYPYTTAQRNGGWGTLIPGHYYLWARAAWDTSIQSVKQPFDIVSSEDELESEILLMDEDGNFYTTKVCPTSTEVTLYYSFGIEGGELFDELVYSFQIGSLADGLLVDVSDTFVDETVYATEVTFATECTKYATLTVDGTVTAVHYDNEEATEVIEELYAIDVLTDGLVFVLDMANPTALVIVEPVEALSAPASITVATLTFLASDTKCIQPYDEKITFEVTVYKGSQNWEATFTYGEPVIVLGADSEWENELTINAFYEATKTTSDDAEIVLVFDIKDLDLVAILATMTVHDCCCEECLLECPCVDCGVGGNITHETEATAVFHVDNVFFSSMLDIEDIVELGGFLGEEGETPTIPATPGIAGIIVKFADAYWTSLDWGFIEWEFYNEDGTAFLNEGYLFFTPINDGTETILATCTGWVAKTQVTFLGTLTADPADIATETLLTMVATAMDQNGNEFVLYYDFLFDTIPPTLTHFTAFRNQLVNTSYIEFKFDQKPESYDLILSVEGSGDFFYDEEDAYWNGNILRLMTGVTLPLDGVVTLGATVTDLAGNVGFSTKQATVSLSNSR
jgi:hypothetical protein